MAMKEMIITVRAECIARESTAIDPATAAVACSVKQYDMCVHVSVARSTLATTHTQTPIM
eukprot:539159-Rhodomonas_salina.1